MQLVVGFGRPGFLYRLQGTGLETFFAKLSYIPHGGAYPQFLPVSVKHTILVKIDLFPFECAQETVALLAEYLFNHC